MNTLHIHSLPLKDVIKDLARKMNTDYCVNCNEYTVNLPSQFGSGKITGINFEGGLGLLIYRCEFICDLEISFTVDDVHPLKFLYCLEGALQHRFEKQNEIHNLEQYQNIIVASPHHDGHILNFKKNVYTEIYSLEIDRKSFKSQIACELGKATPDLQEIFQDDRGERSFYYNGHYSLRIAEIFEDLKSHQYDDLIGKMFSQSQSYRMLTEQLIQFSENKTQDNNHYVRQSDLSALKEAVEIIENEIDSLEPISSLAKRVGLNTKRFQNGFQSLFGKTANEYIQSYRLSLARDLLIHTEDTVEEIKDKVGLKSHSYFSQLFKKVYHVSPSEFRQNHINKKRRE